MKRDKSEHGKRRSYHHGDLKQALLEAGVTLAREGGGPDAVALREATRRAGVAPNAAYRHYASRHDLVQAVRSAALAGLARAIEQEMAGVDETADPVRYARDSLRAVGTGYVKFAVAEPGLFRTAFTVPDDLQGEAVPEKAGRSGMNPFQLLGLALDRCLDAGLMSAAQRQGAEFIAWSAVHGLAMLVIDGPLRELPPEAVRGLGQRVLDMVEAGLTRNL
ncbi:MAG TPA: TetR/AcrR family transcriptional regulator [Mariprofundaceae bacterium]|nr:TetR/AcrR family transcriptional regulator [Mariprofundaceae bacterium]